MGEVDFGSCKRKRLTAPGPRGPRYLREAAMIQRMTEAEGVLLVVLAGYKGSGVSLIAPPQVQAGLVVVLRRMAADIERDLGERVG